MSVLRDALGLLSESSDLTPDESKLLGLMTGPKKLNDKAIRMAMRLDQHKLLRLGEKLRASLGIPAGGSIRDHVAKATAPIKSPRSAKTDPKQDQGKGYGHRSAKVGEIRKWSDGSNERTDNGWVKVRN